MACLISKSTGVYRPRQPLESDFHRLVRQHWDEFRAVYADRYTRKIGHWRPVYDKAARHFLKCGDLKYGFARVRCPDCRHEFFVAFSCKQRCICPSCSQKRTILFGLHVSEGVCLDVPHRQFVWTVPKRLRIFFRYHRDLLRELPRLAWQTIQTVYRALLGDEATIPGGVFAIQTFGQLLHFHPHIHALVTDGAFTPSGRFLHLPVNLGHEPFLKLWENAVFSLLLGAGRIEPALVSQMRSWRHSGFSVDRSVRLRAGDRNGIQRLAEYMARSPFSLARLVKITPTGHVVYRAEKHTPQRFPIPTSEVLAPGPARNFHIFKPLDFLAQIVQHIPDKGEHLIRYYGHYSNKARGIRAKRIAETADGSPSSKHAKPNPARLDHRRWAMLIQQMYHVDPLLCPKCGGTMKIIAFIEANQGNVIRKILQHCGLWDFCEKPAPRPPPKPQTPRRKESFPLFHAALPENAGQVDPDFLEHLRYVRFSQLCGM
ncbi:MAG: IS91 family transposase [Planctomycetes bacterium]|jgi:ribosomal protein S27E|nr:IS91 family transposase [Planctomycetota bacterium]